MKYAPLQDYLKGIAPAKERITLSFEQIEKIINAKLPASAFTYREWWANQQAGSRAPHWQSAGFVVDSVDLKRKLAYFQRETAARKTKRHTHKNSKSEQDGNTIPQETLLNSGFIANGCWELVDGRPNFPGKLSTAPCVYAHVVDGYVRYIGSTLRGFRTRMGHYRKPGATQSTSIRINKLIADELLAGKSVTTIVAFPEATTWNRLPVSRITGLETGLVAALSPPWNKRGVRT